MANLNQDDANQQVADWLAERQLEECTPDELEAFYQEALTGASVPSRATSDTEWEEHHGYITKTIYVKGEGMKDLPFYEDGIKCHILRIDYGEWTTNPDGIATIEVYEEG